MTSQTFTKKIQGNPQAQLTVFRVLLVTFCMLVGVYFYGISSITFNVIARKSLDMTIQSLGDSVSQLEVTYLAKTNTIDKSFALSRGYIENTKSIFASRDGASVARR